MYSNYPDGMTGYDYWYIGYPDRYGHCIGEGYAYNSTEYDPEYDEEYCSDEEDEEDDEDSSDDE